MANWDDMRVFLQVARAESLTAAGQALRLDPGTVGRRVSRLEASVGASLFAKSPQGYALTDRGAALRRHLEEAEAAIATGLEQSSETEGLAGQIRIGAPDGVANYLLPQVCAQMRRDNPDLEIQVLALPRVVNLSKREADLAITVSPPDAGRLTVQKIADYALHLAMRRDAPVPEALADLKDTPFVGYIPDMIFDRALDYLSDAGRDTVQMASNSVAVQLQMLVQGGVGVAHDFALPFYPDLRRVLTEAFELQRAYYLVRHVADRKSDRINRVATALIAGLKQEIARLEAAVSLTDGAAKEDAKGRVAKQEDE